MGVCGGGPFDFLDSGTNDFALSSCFEDLLAASFGTAASLWFVLKSYGLLCQNSTTERSGWVAKELRDLVEMVPLGAKGASTQIDNRIERLASERTPEAVSVLRSLANRQMHQGESAPLHVISGVAVLAIIVIRAVAASGDTSRGRAIAYAELVAWVASAAYILLLSARRQPRSTSILLFWCSMTGFAGCRLYNHEVRRLYGAQLSVFAASGLFTVYVALSALLFVVVVCVVLSHRASPIWRVYEETWCMQQDAKASRIWRLLRMGYPDKWYIVVGISGFVAHSTAKVGYQLLYGQLIDAVYEDDRPAMVQAI
jgi:hypothetical protein